MLPAIDSPWRVAGRGEDQPPLRFGKLRICRGAGNDRIEVIQFVIAIGIG